MKILKTLTGTFSDGVIAIAELKGSMWKVTIGDGLSKELFYIDHSELKATQEFLSTLQAEGDKLCGVKNAIS